VSAADRLALRNDLIEMLTTLDSRLVFLAAEESTNRVVSEFRFLLDKRDEITDFLKELNVEPAPMPVGPNEMKQP